MRFNISYFGPERIFNLRRDFFLLLKYGLESNGHEVVFAGHQLEANAINLLVGAYFLSPEQMLKLRKTGVPYAVVNTEIVKDGMLNFQPKKTDLENAYIPLIKGGKFSWDVVPQNIPELKSVYGIDSALIRWAYHEKLEELEVKEEPDLDFYFFGFVTERRKRMIDQMEQKGLKGLADHSCPYFLRNDRISRAKVQINIRQDVKYVHVNAFRIGYLANNRTAILSEQEEDPTNYLQYAEVVDKSRYAEAAIELARGGRWKQLREESYELYREIHFKDVMEAVLESSLARAS
ncbi:hypothetical protein [Thalassobaculum salexigens]|uniref:hypothetical protein n=1 Tax=Thalassobaculum salexigens TaxID=455360 RepID=UPI00048AE49C|nr:hypothetical protein [Thalassobaculum salexigens]